MNQIEEQIKKYRAKGYSEMRAHIYAFNYEIGRIEVSFKLVMNLTNSGYTLEKTSEYLEIPLKEVKEMVDYCEDGLIIYTGQQSNDSFRICDI